MHVLTHVCHLEESAQIMRRGFSHCAGTGGRQRSSSASSETGLGQGVKSALGTTKALCFADTEILCSGPALSELSHL